MLHMFSSNYKDFEKHVYDWSIKPLKDATSSEYWQYMFAKHEEYFAEKFEAKRAHYPKGWKHLQEENAIANLDAVYKYVYFEVDNQLKSSSFLSCF